MDFYKRGFQLDNIDIPDYTNPKHPTNPPAKRKPHAQPGMSALLNIVAGLQKDVKRINVCLTKQRADEYIAKNKKNGCYAWEGDITWPNNVPDGIPEVIITDSKGNIKIVNGYTLTKSTYPQRKLYRSMYTTPEDRKANPYTQFRKQLRTLVEDSKSRPVYAMDGTEAYSELYNVSHPETHDPKQFYKQAIFDIVYNVFKETVIQEDEQGNRTYEASRDL